MSNIKYFVAILEKNKSVHGKHFDTFIEASKNINGRYEIFATLKIESTTESLVIENVGEFYLPKEVMNLFIATSKERDYYRDKYLESKYQSN